MYLGIDVGTQGLSVVLTDRELNLVGTGEADYGMRSGLSDGCYEQCPADWEQALVAAMQNLRDQLPVGDRQFGAQAIGVAGQMHGEVHLDESGAALGPARLWCDSRN